MIKKILCFVFLFGLIGSFTSMARQPQRGYRGFIDWNNFLEFNFGFLAGDPGDSRFYTGFTTSHGYQFNDWLYVGGGTGFTYNLNYSSNRHENDFTHFVIPVFAEGRLDAKWGRFTPYFSTQLGVNVVNHGGVYLSPMVGYRFNWGRKSAINFGVGMTLFGHRVSYLSYDPIEENPNGTLKNNHGTWMKFTARLGFEF